MLQTKKLTKSFGTIVKSIIMILEELIFTLQGRQLVSALFASRGNNFSVVINNQKPRLSVDVYFFNCFSNENTRTLCEILSKLTMKTLTSLWCLYC